MELKQQGARRHNNALTAPILVFGILVLLRLVLSARLPSYILSDLRHDDGWVVARAMYILNGEWFGPYDQYALIKGAFSPSLMAFSAYIGVSFNYLNVFFYCVACIVFIFAIRPIIKNQWLQVLLFAIILFNPITYALETSQRIYRNGIGQWQILLIFGCLIAIYLRRSDNWKSLLGWAVGAGLVIGAFSQTREDGTWIYPFILGSIACTAICFWQERQIPRTKIAIFLLPLAIAWSVSGLVAIINYSQYGALVTNDRGGGNFAKVAGDLYAIKPNADDEKRYEASPYKEKYYNIYVSTVEKAFNSSPALNSASQKIRDAIGGWARGEEPKTGELSTDHVLFALRDGVKAAGYYQSLPQTEAFYGKVHEELQVAFGNGTLVKRGLAISPLIKRVQMHDLATALSFMPEAIFNISKFRDVSSKSLPAVGSAVNTKNFRLAAGGEYFTAADSALAGSGWAFAEDDKTQLTAGLYSKLGAKVADVTFQSGEDVFGAFKSKFQNAKLSRFSFRILGYDLGGGLTLRFYDKVGTLTWELPLNGSINCGGTDGLFHYCIDNLKSEFSTQEFYDRFAHRANQFTEVYHKTTPFLGALACLIYLFATARLVSEFRKKKAIETLPVWLVLSGILSTFLLFIFAMCIITATSFNSLTYLYTAPAYILLLMFCGVALAWAGEAVLEYRKRERL